jgi:glycosyltransferase involved in cell wall biosynthesis
MSVPAISVAMSVYNNAAFLDQAVESILAQSFGDFEFLIVDDGSNDGSSEILDTYAARDRRIRIIRQENRGLIASLNRLLDEARAPLIARMDGDDISLPLRFERQIAFLEAHPDHGVVGSWSRDIDASGRTRAGEFREPPTSHEALVARADKGPLLAHSSVMMRSEVVRQAGGYRAAFRHCEDYDLWLRLSERTKLCSLPERLLLYRHSLGQVSCAHVFAQQIGAAIAFEAHAERIAGRPDPTAGLERLPPVDRLDALFGREGVARVVREKVAKGIVYSPIALRGEGYDLLLDHVREGGSQEGLWRTVARLLKLGEPARALRLAATLAAS